VRVRPPKYRKRLFDTGGVSSQGTTAKLTQPVWTQAPAQGDVQWQVLLGRPVSLSATARVA